MHIQRPQTLSKMHSLHVLIVLYLLLNLTVCLKIKPKLTEFKRIQTQNVGSKFRLYCSAQEGTKPFRFEWLKNGRAMQISQHNIETSEDESLFIIPKLTIQDSANYSCIVRNELASDTQHTLLTVQGLIFVNLV